MAAANTIHVDIVSAEGEMFSGDAKMVFAPASQGDLGIAPRHAPLLTLLSYRSRLFMSAGMLAFVMSITAAARQIRDAATWVGSGRSRCGRRVV